MCIDNPKQTFGLDPDMKMKEVVETLASRMHVPHFKEKQVCETQCAELGHDCKELSSDDFCCKTRGDEYRGSTDCRALPTAKVTTTTTTTTTKAVATTKGGSCPSKEAFVHNGGSDDACYWWCHKAGFTCKECKLLDPNNCKKMDSGKITKCCMGADNKCECIPLPKITFGLPAKMTPDKVTKKVKELMFVPHFKDKKKQVCQTKCAELGHDCGELSDEGFACCKVSGEELGDPDDCRMLPMDKHIRGWEKVDNECKQSCNALTINGNGFQCIGRLLIISVKGSRFFWVICLSGFF